MQTLWNLKFNVKNFRQQCECYFFTDFDSESYFILESFYIKTIPPLTYINIGEITELWGGGGF